MNGGKVYFMVLRFVLKRGKVRGGVFIEIKILMMSE